MTAAANSLLTRLLLRGGGKTRRLWAWLALFLGTFFLLLALSMWWNFRLALRGSTGSDALGSGFFTVSRTITDADMGLPGKVRFSDAEIAALADAPGVEEVGKLTQAAFPVSAAIGGETGFSTLLFLEAVPDHMLDTLPAGWQWNSSQNEVPIILAKEFLRTYNYVFAPAQGLPQLSENAVQAIGFDLMLGSGAQVRSLRGQIVGFSDRVTSVLVPQVFLDEMHRQFDIAPPPPARLLVRAQDPSDPRLIDWLKSHQYEVSSERKRQATLRRVVSGISIGMGLLAGVLLASGLSLSVLIIRLLLAEAGENLRLLRELGYSPAQMTSFVTRRFLPLPLSSLLAAFLGAVALNAIGSRYLTQMGIYWPWWPSWVVVAGWLVVGVFIGIVVRRSIRQAVSG